MNSILQTEKKCYITGKAYGLHRHHIFSGPNRKNSEKYGCWVYLIPELHNMSDRGVHFDKELDLRLKRECQAKFEEIYDHDTFMAVFGKNYL
ncbi:MAG: hypothetical protein ACI4OB_06840 [Christensenellales bacterium]